jgi:membrane protein implicated in regulation of membrane protease activity
MIVEWIVSLGAWNWFILSALFFVLELLVPGVFMMWLGLAAIVVALVSVVVALSWQAQVIAFAVLSLIAIPAWRYFARKVERPTDQPHLNRRSDGYVGREFTLEAPIAKGVGTVRIDDTVWRVMGADMPAGARVRVTRTDGPTLYVEAAG